MLCFQVGNVVEHSDGSVVFVFMFAYTMATIAQCFCISVFFCRANLAAASAGIIYFCTYLPYPLCTRYEEYMQFQEKFLAVSTVYVTKNLLTLKEFQTFFLHNGRKQRVHINSNGSGTEFMFIACSACCHRLLLDLDAATWHNMKNKVLAYSGPTLRQAQCQKMILVCWVLL